jgi:hypothetical protein
MQNLDIRGLIVAWLSLDEKFEVFGCDTGYSNTDKFIFDVYLFIFFEFGEERDVEF